MPGEPAPSGGDRPEPESRVRRLAVAFVRLLLRLFFRSVEVVGRDRVPAEGGGLVVSWHPNGLVDPALILVTFPRRVIFGARDGIFRMPVVGTLARMVGSVPLYRREDSAIAGEAERRAANRRSLEALARAVAGGELTGVFPEGHSHDRPDVGELKRGAARLFYQAWEAAPAGAPPPWIVPVGLHYDRKTSFGSRALVEVREPLELPPELARLPATEEERRAMERELTAVMERALEEAVQATGSWREHRLIHRARRLVAAERVRRAGRRGEAVGMRRRVAETGRLWSAFRELARGSPARARALARRLGVYDRQLRRLGLRDHELDSPPRGRAGRGGLLLLLQLVALVFVPPVLLVGWLVNVPPALLLAAGTRLASSGRHRASYKIIGGLFLFPLTWVAVAVAVGWGESRLHLAYPSLPDAPVLTALLAFALSAVGGLVALDFQRFFAVWWRWLRVRWVRRRRPAMVGRLREERARLSEALAELDRSASDRDPASALDRA